MTMKVECKLKEVLKTRGVTQSALAEKLSVSRPSIRSWCLGLTCPPIDVAYKVGRILGVPASTIWVQTWEDDDSTTLKVEKVLSYSKQYADYFLSIQVEDDKESECLDIGIFSCEEDANRLADDLLPSIRECRSVEEVRALTEPK